MLIMGRTRDEFVLDGLGFADEIDFLMGRVL